MKRALLVIYDPAHFTELSRVAKVLRDSGSWTVEIFFPRRYPVQARDIATARGSGYDVLESAGGNDTSDGGTTGGAAPTGAPPRPRAKLRAFLARRRNGPIGSQLLHRFPFRLLEEIDKSAHRRRLASWLLETRAPDLLIFAEENIAFEDFAPPVLIRAGHARGIASLVLPYTVADATEIAEGLAGRVEWQVRGIPGRLVSWFAPHWIHRRKNGEQLLRLPAEMALSREWTGTSTPRPWSFYAGEADAFAVESDVMREYWRKEGLPENRLVSTGALYDDVLATGVAERESRRRKLVSELGFGSERPLVVCAIPPALLDRCKRSFEDFPALVRFWVDSLASLEANIVLRFHPSMPVDSWRFLERSNVRISTADTAALVPLADLYVASISATIRWAIASGIPVVNYDVYEFGYTDYERAPGVFTVRTKEEFIAALSRFAPGTSGNSELARKQSEIATSWGRLDGKAATRILELTERIVSECAKVRA